MTAISQVKAATAAVCGSCHQPVAPGYLGLVLDWKNRVVARGDAPPVRLPHSLLMVLEALIAAQGNVVSENDLLLAYRKGTHSCERLISKKISHVRLATDCLGIEIRPVRHKGYKLVDGAPAKAMAA